MRDLSPIENPFGNFKVLSNPTPGILNIFRPLCKPAGKWLALKPWKTWSNQFHTKSNLSLRPRAFFPWNKICPTLLDDKLLIIILGVITFETPYKDSNIFPKYFLGTLRLRYMLQMLIKKKYKTTFPLMVNYNPSCAHGQDSIVNHKWCPWGRPLYCRLWKMYKDDGCDNARRYIHRRLLYNVCNVFATLGCCYHVGR
jgi:hypothetical protein